MTYVDCGSSSTTSGAPTVLKISTSQPTYLRIQSAQMTAVLTESSSLSGYAITFTITKPNGTVVTVSSTTSSNGMAAGSYRIKKNDPSGIYTVTASGASAQATTSFTVQ